MFVMAAFLYGLLCFSIMFLTVHCVSQCYKLPSFLNWAALTNKMMMILAKNVSIPPH